MTQEPTLEVDKFGNRRWWLDGQPHRTDGPAVEWADGSRSWCLNGQYHRTDGPAVEYADGDRSWYLNDRPYTFQEWLDKINVDERTRILMVLKYGS